MLEPHLTQLLQNSDIPISSQLLVPLVPCKIFEEEEEEEKKIDMMKKATKSSLKSTFITYVAT
ncbi:hypothetical protein CFP56_016771 [Quercus suber]|uniref:Uncharacterized protein n=1 Tax=Quercus suber TaxID=58331 RepID=A0AAW0KNV5_QUESU